MPKSKDITIKIDRNLVQRIRDEKKKDRVPIKAKIEIAVERYLAQ